VDRFKQVRRLDGGSVGAEFTGTAQRCTRPIGASTFIEKGWSLISLGTTPARSRPCRRRWQLSPGETQAESLLGWAQMLHEDYDDALGTFKRSS